MFEDVGHAAKSMPCLRMLTRFLFSSHSKRIMHLYCYLYVQYGRPPSEMEWLYRLFVCLVLATDRRQQRFSVSADVRPWFTALIATDTRQTRRMGQCMHRLQSANGDMGVNLRRRQLRVPQDRLDVPNIGAVFQHMRGHRVAKRVAAAAVKTGMLHVELDHVR